MYLPKQDIYELLKTLNVGVSQSQPTIFNELPYITFRINNNRPNLSLENEILYQDIEVQIDIWGNTSVEVSNLLSQVEELLRNELWIMTYSSDVPNTSDIFHSVARFQNRIGGK